LARLNQRNANAFMFVDEPGLQFLFSSMSGYGDLKAKGDLDQFSVLVCADAKTRPPRNLHWGIMKLDSKMTVSELMTYHPSAIDVFVKRKMFCIGFPTDRFHTIEDVARINGILLEHLLKELRDAICVQERTWEYQPENQRRVVRSSTALRECAPVDISDEDVMAAMEAMQGEIDITPADFREVCWVRYHLDRERIMNALKAADIMTTPVHVLGATPMETPNRYWIGDHVETFLLL
jgi:hybrid cluster-associated redox disulfide protein